MKLQQLSFVAAIAATTLTIGCATGGQSKAREKDETPHAAMAAASDAVVHISGVS